MPSTPFAGQFTGARVLVTGASRGIGRAIAVSFADAGARVAVHFARDEQAARETVDALAGEGHVCLRADLSDPADAERLIREMVARLGGLDVLVNNAGIYDLVDPVTASYPRWQEHLERTLATNLVGPANLMFLAAREMTRPPNHGGRIVNVSSRGAFRGEPHAPAYGASKAGLNALGQSLAVALAPHGVFVGTVAPGYVATEMVADLLAGPGGAAIREQSPLGRVATPEEVAYAVLFLASPQAAFTTGAVLDVNGASYLR
jgi:NAD(P)-dependent dehydrogenase (short-subunit alcohol dehydrogenase family)